MKGFQIFAVLFIWTIKSQVMGQGIQPGFCTKRQGVGIENLNITRFLGDWYEYGRTPHDIEAFGRCTAYRFHKPIGEEWPYSRLIVSYANDTKSNITSNLAIGGPRKGKNDEGYTIKFVAVRYKKYAVVFGCRQSLFVYKQEIVWILTRERFPDDETISMAYQKAEDFRLSLKNFKTIDQKNCPPISAFDDVDGITI